jgi:hypothetical protein
VDNLCRVRRRVGGAGEYRVDLAREVVDMYLHLVEHRGARPSKPMQTMQTYFWTKTPTFKAGFMLGRNRGVISIHA